MLRMTGIPCAFIIGLCGCTFISPFNSAFQQPHEYSSSKKHEVEGVIQEISLHKASFSKGETINFTASGGSGSSDYSFERFQISTDYASHSVSISAILSTEKENVSASLGSFTATGSFVLTEPGTYFIYSTRGSATSSVTVD